MNTRDPRDPNRSDLGLTIVLWIAAFFVIVAAMYGVVTYAKQNHLGLGEPQSPREAQ